MATYKRKTYEQAGRQPLSPLPRRDLSSPSRRLASPYEHCGIKEHCQSCRYINAPYKDKLEEKYRLGIDKLQALGLLRYARCLPPVASPRPLAYRSTAKLAIRKGTGGEPVEIGLFKPESHHIIDICQCPLHLVAINKLLRALKKELALSPLQPWDETTSQGDLRYLVVRASHITNELLLTFVGPDEGVCLQLKAIVRRLRDEYKIAGAHFNLNASPGNAIFGAKTVKLLGSDKLRESLCDLKLALSPKSFFQVNPWQAHNIYRRLEQLAGPAVSAQAVAWDLYAGVGPISMLLARCGYKVLAIEENPDAVADAQQHYQMNALGDRIHCLTGRVEELQAEIPGWAQSPQLIVANPSRKGIAPESREQLKALFTANPQLQFLYVSCDIDTFTRDLTDLESAGFKVRQVEAFDIFAQTDKLEWLAIMTR